MRRCFAYLRNRVFDLLVVGGGIYGAWTAYDAALRGLVTALVDAGDWAAGTSSRSTKLIHGGLRYLAQGNLNLVRKSLAERHLLMRLCPHRVRPLRFGVPIRSQGDLRRWRLRCGLWLYDLLGETGVPRQPHAFLSAGDFLARFPWLESRGVQAGALYGDAQTDDARQVLELVDGAVSAGAACVNYCRVVAFRTGEASITGAVVKDGVSGMETLLQARCIVQATGPWLAELPGRSTAGCRLSKGVHLVMPGLPGREALLFQVESDGRVAFLIPWYGRTLLGTTDTDYTGDPQGVGVEPKDVDYLLSAANRVLAAPGWNQGDILGSFAGLRVLQGAGRTYALRRDWAMEEAPDGSLLSVGGKLTTARRDAAAIVDRVCRKLGMSKTSATGALHFPWAPQGDYEAYRAMVVAEGLRFGLAEAEADWLLFRHGRRIGEIYSAIDENPELGKRLLPDLPFLRADLLHCARHEMVVHLEDLLRRRLPLLLLHRLERTALQEWCADVGLLLGWDEARRGTEIEHCLTCYGGDKATAGPSPFGKI